MLMPIIRVKCIVPARIIFRVTYISYFRCFLNKSENHFHLIILASTINLARVNMTVRYIKYIIKYNGPVKLSSDAVYSILLYNFVISNVVNYRKIGSVIYSSVYQIFGINRFVISRVDCIYCS